MTATSTPHPLHTLRAQAYLLLLFLLGVALPAFTLGFELTNRLSAQTLFDPVPTVFHGALIALVPASNAWLLWVLTRNDPRVHPGLARAQDFAMGVALFYAILYLPITPLAPFAVLLLGMGLLPLAPLLSFVAGLSARHLLDQRLREQGHSKLPPVGRGLLLGVVVLIAADLPSTVTHWGLQRAVSEDAKTQISGVRLLRAVGNESLLLRLCYNRSGHGTDLLGTLFFRHGVSPEQVRRVFYQVTGEPFNTRPAPPQRSLRQAWDGDLDTGGTQVGNRVRGVTLAASQLEGSLDADASLGYLEWMMVFRNDSTAAQEGRAQIALPPGAVVSRLTLWIDGEPREAAFGTRAATRQAYEKVVRQQRDPVLVTTAGPDRVLVQFFPIPANGGEMKLRLGITAPLPLDNAALARLQLPVFRERNFEIPDSVTHGIELQAERPLRGSAPWRASQPRGKAHRLQAQLHAEALDGAANTVLLERNPEVLAAWSHASDNANNHYNGAMPYTVQRLNRQVATPPQRLALVIDGSAGMAAAAEALAQAVDALPRSAELALFVASDHEPGSTTDTDPGRMAQALRAQRFVGGQDNLRPLEQAWDWAAQSASGAVVWVHGPQPVLLGSAEPLRQRMDIGDGSVRLHALEAVPGSNLVLSALDGSPGLAAAARGADVGESLRRLLAPWAQGAVTLVAQREAVASVDGLPQDSVKTSAHLTRLWAADQVHTLLATGEEPDRRAATALALQHHLVTPVSGAVVLETAQQFDEAGLSPVESGSVPTIPEPEEWMLMAAVALFLAWAWRRRARPLGAFA